MNRRREIISPAPGSPNWLPSGKPPGGLLYLGWGRRHYGRHPIPSRMHDGWTYTVITSGHPTLIAGNDRRRLAPGSLLVAGPDVPLGWEDKEKAVCSVLVWVWNTKPQWQSAANASPRLCWIRSTSGADLDDFAVLHQDTRREITLADSHTPDVLATIQRRLDAEFERAAGLATRAVSHDAQRLQLAHAWMRRHLDVRSPIAALADYLGISAMTLSRLFRRSIGRSPGDIYLAVKMQRAAELLADPNASVKKVALELGYRHTGDFSRAFNRFHGYSPNRFRLRPTKRFQPL